MIVKIEKLIHGGSGAGAINGKKVFVPYAAPGDLLDVSITASHRGYDEALIIKVVEPASCRIEPRCPVFGRCGGCQWQHISYEAQLKWKENILVETLERLGGIKNPPVEKAVPSKNKWHYRNRIQLHVRGGRVGFYAPKTNEVVEFEECFIAEEKVNRSLAQIKDELRTRDRGVSIEVSAREGSFLQVNSGQNEILREMICGYLKELPHREVVELYAGSGNFTFALAAIAQNILASDIDKRAIDFGKKRAVDEGVTNIKFLPLCAEETLQLVKTSPDCLILDPPRKGAADILERVLELKPKSIIYISCEPSTLARDLKILLATAYKLDLVQPIDMFPQTFHVESVSVMS